jgi:addiction module HigA family antidote
MHKPPHPGIVLADILKQKQITPREFAMRLRVDERLFVEILSGNRSIDSPLAAKINHVLQENTPEHWYYMQKYYDKCNEF